MIEPKDREEANEAIQELAQQIAVSTNWDVQKVIKMLDNAVQVPHETVTSVAKKIEDAFIKSAYLPRPPAEIKKDIKYERNPMRLKQLNKELNESCKFYKRK